MCNKDTLYWSIRTAGLEQEIENLKNKLESCVKENSDLKQQLSEAKRITVSLTSSYIP